MTLTSEEIPVRVPPYETGNWQDDYGAGAPSFWTEKSPISYRLLVFHRRLENLLHQASRQGGLHAMLFSDGAFVVMPQLEHLVELAREIMRTCLVQKIPVRMGIATGTFHPLKFGSDTIGEVGIYSSLFYGTGVVRAHCAERAGKGMRILVHPSVASQLTAGATTVRAAYLEYPDYQLIPLATPIEHASWELDYLSRWKGKPWARPKVDPGTLEDEKLWEAVKEMKSRAPDDPRVRQHYDETQSALNRMRERLERPLLT